MPKLQLDGGIDDGIEAEDLLFAIGVLGVATYTDAGIEVRRQFGAAEEEGVSAFGEIHLGEQSSLDHQIETGLLEGFLETEDLIEDARFFARALPARPR